MISTHKHFTGLAVAAGVGAQTGVLLQTVDLMNVDNIGDQVVLEIEVVTNGTAPGASKTLTAYAAFCSDAGRTAAELATAALTQTLDLPDSSSVRRIYMLPTVYIGARYLYFWFDNAALAALAALTINVRVNLKRN